MGLEAEQLRSLRNSKPTAAAVGLLFAGRSFGNDRNEFPGCSRPETLSSLGAVWYNYYISADRFHQRREERTEAVFLGDIRE